MALFLYPKKRGTALPKQPISKKVKQPKTTNGIALSGSSVKEQCTLQPFEKLLSAVVLPLTSFFKCFKTAFSYKFLMKRQTLVVSLVAEQFQLLQPATHWSC